MTAYARIITTGKNGDMPKTVTLPFGVGVDGAVIRFPVTIGGDEMICPTCKGWGCDEWQDRCEHCCGDGIVKTEQDTGDGSGCLSTSPVGRTAQRLQAVRPPSPGTKPVARATGDLSSNVHRPVAHSVMRRVPAPHASHSQAVEMPPNAPPGIFLERILDVATTLAGIGVFASVAFFFLVLS